MDASASFTYAEIRAWPAVVSLARAAAALGVSRTTAYKMVAASEFPARCFRVGGQWKVSTESILSVLGADTTPQERA